MNKSERLLKNTMILSIGTICTKVISFVMIPFFSSWLSAADYGDFDLLCTYVSLLIPFLTLSCGEALFRKIIDAKDSNRRKAITSGCTMIALIGIACLLLVAPIVFHFYRPELTIPFIVMTISELLYNFLCYYARGKKQLTQYTIASIVYILVMSVSVTVLIKFFSFGLPGIIYGYAAGYLVSALFILITTRFFADVKFQSITKKDMKEILGYSAPLIPNTISWWIANVSDRTIVTIVLGSTVNGIYSVANKIPSICTALLSVFHISWQETSIDAVNDQDKDSYFQQMFNGTFNTILSFTMCVLSTNFFLFEYVFDSKYYDGRFQVPFLMFSIAFSFMAQFLGGIFIGLQKTKINGATTVIAAVTNIIVHLALIQFIGLYAASVSTLVSYLVLFFARLILIKKDFNVTVDPKNWILCAIMVVCGALQFVQNLYIHIGLIVVSGIMFIFINKKLIISIVNKVLKRKVS